MNYAKFWKPITALLTGGTATNKVHGSTADGASVPNGVVIAGKDGAGKTLSAPINASGLAVQQTDATKLNNTEANSGAIKNALTTSGAYTLLGDIKTAQTSGDQIAQTRRQFKRIAFTKANDDATAITLATGVNDGTWELTGVRLIQSGGTSTTTQYAIAEIAGASPPDTNTIYRASAATAKGTLVSDSFVEALPCLADAGGNLYLFSGRDANNDSTVAGVVYLRLATAL